MRRPRRAGDQLTGHADRWLVSYADFITLLFAFFVTMYAISTVDARKLAQIVAGMQVAFADRTARAGGGAPPAWADLAAAGAAAEAGDTLNDLEQRLFYRLRAVGSDRVELGRDHRGLVITVKEAGTFATGRADLDATAAALFRDIGLSLVDIPNVVRVEGHTDDRPINSSRYSSNWELSTARATSVIAFLVQEVGLSPERLSAAGYGEFRPRVPNDSDEHRARNRRVDLIVLNEQTASREEPRARP
jgi:chemotaxis protein MotB